MVTKHNQWLIKQLKEEASHLAHGNKMIYVYRKANRALRKYPIDVVNAKQAELLHGIGTSMAKKIRTILEENGKYIEVAPSQRISHARTLLAKRRKRALDKKNLPDAKRQKIFIPRKMSACYSFLLVLKRSDKHISKKNLIKEAQEFCEHDVRDRWSDMGCLLRKGLVERCVLSKIPTYNLTKEGSLLAGRFWELRDRELDQIANEPVMREKRPSPKLRKPPRPPPKKLRRDPIRDEAENELDASIRHGNIPVEVATFGDYYEVDMRNWEIVLLIDSRERFRQDREFISKQFKKLKVLCETRTLALGDFLWVARGRVGSRKVERILDCVVERKRVSDLASSIKDRRYESQKYRLGLSGFNRIIYLIEGNPNHQDILDPSTLLYAQISTSVREFQVHQTKTLSESVRYLKVLTELLRKEVLEKGFTLEIEYDEFHQICSKKQLLEPDMILGPFLMTIKGVSHKIAQAILAVYPTIHDLIAALENDPECLRAIKTDYRSISGPVITRIQKTFTLEEYDKG